MGCPGGVSGGNRAGRQAGAPSGSCLPDPPPPALPILMPTYQKQQARPALRPCRQTTPSGALTLDLALGGGYPRGRVVEIYGPGEAARWQAAAGRLAGSSTAALHRLHGSGWRGVGLACSGWAGRAAALVCAPCTHHCTAAAAAAAAAQRAAARRRWRCTRWQRCRSGAARWR